MSIVTRTLYDPRPGHGHKRIGFYAPETGVIYTTSLTPSRKNTRAHERRLAAVLTQRLALAPDPEGDTHD